MKLTALKSGEARPLQWYFVELDTSQKVPAFVIYCRYDISDALAGIAKRVNKESFAFGSLTPMSEARFGFNGVAEVLPAEGQWHMRWRIPMPTESIHTKVGAMQLNAASATMGLLFYAIELDLAESSDYVTGNPSQPLLITGWSTNPSAHSYGFAFGVDVLAGVLQKWMRDQDKAMMLFCMEDAMRTVGGAILRHKKSHPGLSGIRARIDADMVPELSTGWDCNCLGFNRTYNTDVEQAKQGRGFSLEPHNADTAVGQLTLFAGICALWSGYTRSAK